jgi:hypothetical protein
MIKGRSLMLRILLAALMLATPALADEVWISPQGEVIYEEDIGTTAVFSVPIAGIPTRLYIENLGGNFDNRIGVFFGYWVAEADGDCTASLLTPEGRGSNMWGRVELVFDTQNFPSGWTARLGDCFHPPLRHLRAVPLQ